jgi:hypothetical protein
LKLAPGLSVAEFFDAIDAPHVVALGRDDFNLARQGSQRKSKNPA